MYNCGGCAGKNKESCLGNNVYFSFEKTVLNDTSEIVAGKVIYEYKGKWQIKD
ncbi:MAG TPA: hypothetical protein PKX15_06110 [Bacteroidales bacterium]|jgi:hypothetical protein|nr:hypothetical protein [Bacteroidales bacterium]